MKEFLQQLKKILNCFLKKVHDVKNLNIEFKVFVL